MNIIYILFLMPFKKRKGLFHRIELKFQYLLF